MKRRTFVQSAGLSLLAAALPLHRLSAQENRRLVVALSTEPDNIDPSLTRSPPVSRPAMDNVFSSMVALDETGTPVPGLATWEWSEDGTQLVFTLRENVLFHSGEPVTADDILFSHERMRANASTYGRSIRLLDSVEVLDERRIRFAFTSAAPTFIRTYIPVMSRRYHEAVGEEAFVRNPVGAGAFRFVAHVPGQHIDLEAFDGYWEGRPALDTVRLRFISDPSARVAALKSGEVDAINSTPFAEVQELEAGGYVIAKSPAHPTVSVALSFGNPSLPWADVRVRQAMAHAIDGNAIVQGLLFGVPDRYARLTPGELGYDPDLQPYAFDPGRARSLLAEAGYPNGFSMRLRYYITSTTGFRETAEAVALFLRGVGINAEVEAVEGSRANELLREMTPDMSTAEWACLMPHAMANWGDPADGLSLSMYSRSPLSVYRNADFDRELESSLGTVDLEARAQHLRNALRILHDDVGSIPIWDNVEVFSLRPGIRYTPVPRTIQAFYAKNVEIG